jgi:uncharacterized repeat protein (TIGR01451 family)
MKYKKTINVLLLIVMSLSAYAGNISMSLQNVGTSPYTIPTAFQVNAQYNYSSLPDGTPLTIVVNYDPTKLQYTNCPNLVGYTITSSGGTITINFTATAGGTSSAIIPLCFGYPCNGAACFGANIPATISGNISTATNSPPTFTANPVNISGSVPNTWSGANSYVAGSYSPVTRRITYQVTASGFCVNVPDPKFTATLPSGCTIVEAWSINYSNVPHMCNVSGNTFTPPSPITQLNGLPVSYSYFYTIQLPCVMSDTVITPGMVLSGTNCSTPGTTIINYTVTALTSFHIPAGPLAIPAPGLSYYSLGTSGTLFSYLIKNTGNVPLNVSVNDLLPDANVTSLGISTTQATGISGTVSWDGCTSPSSSSMLIGLLPQTFTPTSNPSLKSNLQFNNLAPLQTITCTYYFNANSACSGTTPTPPYSLISNMNYVCASAGTSCVPCDTGHYGQVDTLRYVVPPPSPNIQTRLTVSDTCHKPGDTVEIKVEIWNTGNAPLTTGVLQINLPVSAALVYVTGSSVYANFPSTDIPTVVAGSNVQWNITNMAVGAPHCFITFQAVVGNTAIYGSPSLSTTMTSGNYAYSHIYICDIPHAYVLKEVMGPGDPAFSNNSHGMPNATVTYKVTVFNDGTRAIGAIKLLDRLPSITDHQVGDCISRRSNFAITPPPAGIAMTPAFGQVTYSGTHDVTTGWLGVNSGCNGPMGTFLPSPSASTTALLFDLGTVSLLPGTSTSFTFTGNIASGATVGDTAWNTIAMLSSAIDNQGNASPMGTTESAPVSTIVLPPPPPPCYICKSVLTSATLVKNTVAADDNIDATFNITTTKKIQEVRVSISDIDYSYDREECKNCKEAPFTKGSIYTSSASQMLGSLVLGAGYTGYYPAGSHPDQAPQEIKWEMGTAINPGTYSAPIHFVYPKGVNSCCKVTLHKLCLRLSLKDINCNVCDTIICLSGDQLSDDCCNGGKWGVMSVNWDMYQIDHVHNIPSNINMHKIHYEPTGGGVHGTDPLPPYDQGGSINLSKCGDTITLSKGTAYTFNGTYECNPYLKDCRKGVRITVDGTAISNPYTFSSPGVYAVTYSARCGDKVCNSCTYYVRIPANCCTGAWLSRQYNVVSRSWIAGPLINIPTGVPLITTTNAVNLQNLVYSCPQGCTGRILIRRKDLTTNVEVTDTLAALQSSTSIYANAHTQLVTVVATCGGQICNTFSLKVACSDHFCYSVISHTYDGTFDLGNTFTHGGHIVMGEEYINTVLRTKVSPGRVYQKAMIRMVNSEANLVVSYMNLQSGEKEVFVLPLIEKDGYLSIDGIATKTTQMDGQEITTKLVVAPQNKKNEYVGHVTLLK